MRTPKILSRRNFLFAAGAGSVAATAALVAQQAGAPVAATAAAPKDARSGKGYQVTAHIQNYYRTTKI